MALRDDDLYNLESDPFSFESARQPALTGESSTFTTDNRQPSSETPSFSFGTATPRTSSPTTQPTTGTMTTPGLQPSAPTSSPAPAPDFSSIVSQIQGTQDASQQAVLRDKLARDVYSYLGGQGHDVKWQGDQLIVDGRPYIVAGAAPAGYDQSKWSTAESDSAKYIVGRGLDYGALRAIPDQAGREALLAQQIQGLMPQLQAAGWTVHDVSGDRILVSGHGYDPGWVDVIGDISGAVLPAWQPDDAGGAAPSSALPMSFASGAQSVNLATPQLGSSGAAPAAPGWQPGGSTYTPGEIPMGDIPQLSFQDLLAQLTQQGPTDVALEQLIMRELQSPDSLDAHTLDSLKAKSKDELAEQQALDDQELRQTGALMGIDDSNWLASERLASRRDRDRALVSKNRDLDIQAATQNKADRRAAAELGMSFTNQRASQRQAATALAADASLKSAALTGDRLALREAVNQKAAELNLNADQVMSQWLLGMMDNSTRRDIAQLGANIDMAKLNQASQEFKEELAYRLAALAQADQQFGASYGLDVARLQRDLDNDAFGRYAGLSFEG